MKPSLSRKVYCIYEDSILAQPVYAIGQDSFLLDPHRTNEDSWEWYYEDYNETWFSNLNKAKKKLLENYKELYTDKVEVVKVSDDYYELRERRQADD